jgi:hypothetical protein
MSSLAMKRVVATALAGAAIASAFGPAAAAESRVQGPAGAAAGASGSPSVPPPPSSIAASAGKAYEELRMPDRPPPPSSIAAPAGQAYAELRAPDQPAAQPTSESQPVADEPSGFDLPSAAIGAVVGAGLVLALLAAGGLVRRRPLTGRHGTAGA